MIKNWLFRLYLLITVGWVAWFASQAYDANRQIGSAGGYIQAYIYDRRVGNPSAYNLANLAAWQNEQLTRFNSAITAITEGLLVGTIAFLLLEWIRKRRNGPVDRSESLAFEKRAEEIRQNRRTSRFRPASTLLLLVSILFFPLLWLIDPAAMANF